MKTGIIGIVAVAGLMVGMAEPAEAHYRDRDFALRLGPAYVYYGNGFHRVDRRYRHSVRNRHRHFANHRRYIRDRDLWHRCYDGRFYRYYDRRHWRLHDKWRYGKRRHGHRHRH